MAGKAGDIIEYTWTYSGSTYKLFSKAGDVVNYISSGLTEVGAVSIASEEVAVGGYTRKAYPGDPGVTVSGHTRTRLTTTPRTGPNLPGQVATIEAEDEVLNVTFTGPFVGLYELAQAGAVGTFVLRSPDGTPYEIGTP